jgi:hypothetical protein
MDVDKDVRLPRVGETPPNLALMVLGKALAQAYGDTVDETLPAPLARIVSQIQERETATPDQS